MTIFDLTFTKILSLVFEKFKVALLIKKKKFKRQELNNYFFVLSHITNSAQEEANFSFSPKGHFKAILPLVILRNNGVCQTFSSLLMKLSLLNCHHWRFIFFPFFIFL